MKLMRMKSPGLRVIALTLGVSLAIVGLTGCEEDPTTAAVADFPFTLYGVLNPAADTQMVRVFPVESSLTPGSPEPIDATVTSTEVGRGEVLIWRDSILTFEDGTYGYLYWLPFRPEGGHSYRVDVSRSDGETSSATVTVPMLPQVLSAEHGPFNEVNVPIVFEPGDARVRDLEIRQTVYYGWCGGELGTVVFSLEKEVYTAASTVRADFLLDEAYDTIRKKLTDVGLFQDVYGLLPFSFGMTMRATVTDAGWYPPDGSFDPELLIDPGVFRNVENGFGFLGSGYAFETSVNIPKETYVAAGFEPEERPKGGDCVGPIPPDLDLDL